MESRVGCEQYDTWRCLGVDFPGAHHVDHSSDTVNPYQFSMLQYLRQTEVRCIAARDRNTGTH